MITTHCFAFLKATNWGQNRRIRSSRSSLAVWHPAWHTGCCCLGTKDRVGEGEGKRERVKDEKPYSNHPRYKLFLDCGIPDWLLPSFIRKSYNERNIQEARLIHIQPTLSSDWVIMMPDNEVDSRSIPQMKITTPPIHADTLRLLNL